MSPGTSVPQILGQVLLAVSFLVPSDIWEWKHTYKHELGDSDTVNSCYHVKKAVNLLLLFIYNSKSQAKGHLDHWNLVLNTHLEIVVATLWASLWFREERLRTVLKMEVGEADVDFVSSRRLNHPHTVLVRQVLLRVVRRLYNSMVAFQCDVTFCPQY